MTNVLVTGSAGFFGGILRDRLLAEGHRVTGIDLHGDSTLHPAYTSIRCDIRDRDALRAAYSIAEPEVVMHCAAMLAHDVRDRRALWTSNVSGTSNVADLASRHHVRRLVYISSNCLWAHNFGRPITEEDAPRPVEIYGRSKWAGEQALSRYPEVSPIIIRTPTIIDAGRLGLLAILFDFIAGGRKVWVVGSGANRYQFVYAGDLASACILAMEQSGAGTFNVGSDDVSSLRETYEYVIARAQTGARVASLPRRAAVTALRLAALLGISPLGPYHYRMIAEDFCFDTSKIKDAMGWRPTLTNCEMLARAYQYYVEHRDEIAQRSDASAHRQQARMGVLRLVKLVS